MQVLNNELNVKTDFDALAAELKSQGINFNKPLLTLKKRSWLSLVHLPTNRDISLSFGIL